MAKFFVLSIFAVIFLLFAHGNTLTAEDVDSIKISLLPESESPLLVSDKDKPILRYGFHRTHDCQNFEKAFICVRKCLDLNYHIAHSNKDCICTCYKNKDLAKYKAPIDTASTKWKLGAPTTSRPAWAGGIVEEKPNDYEINANYSEYIGEPKDTTLLPEASETGTTSDNGDNNGTTADDEGLTGDGEGSGDNPAGEAEIENAPKTDAENAEAEEAHEENEEEADAEQERKLKRK